MEAGEGVFFFLQENCVPNTNLWTIVESAHNTSSDGSNSPNASSSESSSSNGASGLPGWLIAVIVIACVVFVAALAGLFWFIRRLKRTNAQNNVAAANIRDSKQSDQRNLMQSADASMPTIPRPFAGSISNSNDMSSIHSSTPIMASVRNAQQQPGSPVTQQSSPTKSMAEAELGNKPPTPPAMAHIMQNQEARQSSSILSSTDAIMIADTFRQFMRKPEWNEQHEEEDDDENTFKLGNEPIKQRKPLGDDLFRKNDDNDADNATVHHNDDDKRPKDSSTHG